MSGPDLKALGFMAGLEIHQQLDTPKLFCRCMSRLDETDESHVSFLRSLRPTASELGEVDPAVVEEARKSLRFEYLAHHDSACLVEMDEEPPHAMSSEAMDAALETALLLDALPIEEVHIMRKIVVDGSNTGGFQRTSLVATQGIVRSDEGDVRIASFCLEEDSARRLDRVGRLQRYRLDRLGIPLIEIATEPEIRSPAHAREIAEAIGLALRATGKVKRGIGTIRQDLNVSIREGARVEIKGVQELRLIEPAVAWEVDRQVNLLDVRAKLRAAGAKPEDYATPTVDVTDVFRASAAKMVQGALERGEGVYAVRLAHLAGILGKKGKEEVPPPRVGRELADYAKARAGVKGIFQSDEMPAYGITQTEADAVRAAVKAPATDGCALVLADRATADIALAAVLDRARMLLDGVPEETRDLNPDTTSRYMRPLPGGARMYPETDVPPVRLDAAKIAHIRANLPELPAEKRARFAKDYADLSPEQAKQIVRGGHADDFERMVKETGLVKETARLLLSTLPELSAKGFDVEKATPAIMLDVLRALAKDAFAKEALPQVLEHAATHGVNAEAAAAALGLSGVDDATIVAFIDKMLGENAGLVEKQGMRATGPLMGPLMKEFKGQASGQTLSSLLKERLEAYVANHQAGG